MNPIPIKHETDPGFCPFCKCCGWEICTQFVGYVRGNHVSVESGQTRAGSHALRPKRANDVCVNTGVSIRAYRK